MLTAAAARSSGKYHVADLVLAIKREKMQAWGVERDGEMIATGLTEILICPQKRVCRCIAMQGKGAADWIHLLAGVETWAKSIGCTAVEPFCPRAWKRWLEPLGYRESHVLLEKEI
jgi:hypothetical protein